MGEAREVMDQMTEAAFRKDVDAVGQLYAPTSLPSRPIRASSGARRRRRGT